LSDQFDIVLCSHSLPDLTGLNSGQNALFLAAAWDLVEVGGVLIIITFQGSAGALEDITSEIFRDLSSQNTNADNPEYTAIMSRLCEFGEPKLERVNSYAIADKADEIVSYFTPWIGGVNKPMTEERRAHFRRIIDAQYCIHPDLYVLPTEHLFISCRKTKF
jgi:hypothetical protein